LIHTVLFDIDGTLIRTGGAGVKAFGETFTEAFHLPDATRQMNFAGRTDVSLVRECFIAHDVPRTPENFAKFFDLYPIWLERLLKALPGEVCDGVLDFMSELEQLPHKPRIGLLTGNIRRGAELKLSHYNLWRRFEFGAFADDHEERNQIAAIAQQRASGLVGRAIPGDEILVIGDTPLDIACARAIHAKVIAVATGNYKVDELQNENPTWAVHSLKDLSATKVCGD
jgi:phosphoglycolate phosphatase-like HAD superfamily hydrolase